MINIYGRNTWTWKSGFVLLWFMEPILLLGEQQASIVARQLTSELETCFLYQEFMDVLGLVYPNIVVGGP